MSSFVDKLKSYLTNVLTEKFTTTDAQAVQSAGGQVENGKLTGVSIRGRGRLHREDPLAPEIEAQNASRSTLYGISLDTGEKSSDADPNWRPTVKRYRFRALTQLVDGMSLDKTEMVVTDQTGKFLTYLFDALLKKVKKVDEVTIQRVNKAKDIRKKDFSDMIKSTNDLEFQQYCKRFINFLDYDERFYPESYIITIKVPLNAYKEADIDSICKKFGISAAEFGVTAGGGTSSDLPSVITITLTVTCASTLLNVFNNREFFKVGTNRSSLEKYSFMAKNLQRIFIENKFGAIAKMKDEDKKKGTTRTYIDPRMQKSFITPSESNTNKVSYNPIELVSDMYRNYVSSNNNEILCFLDETGDSYIYLPGNGETGERYFVLKTNGKEEFDGPMNEISKALKEYIEGILSEDEMKKVCNDQMSSDSFKFDRKLSGVDDRVLSIINDFFNGDSFVVEIDANDNEKENYDEILVKPIEAQMNRLPPSDSDRYDEIHAIITDPKIKRSLINGYKNKKYSTIFNDAKNKILKVANETLKSKLTATKFTKEIMNMLTDVYADVHVFRFMYSDRVDATYTIRLPSNTAKNIIKKYGFKEDDLPGHGVIALDEVNVPGSENLPRKHTELFRRRKLGGTDNQDIVDIEFGLSTTANDIVRSAAGSMYGLVQYTANTKLPDTFRVASHIMNLFDLTTGIGAILESLYFKPSPQELTDLIHGQTVTASNKEEFSLANANVRLALNALVNGHDTMIKRNEPLHIILPDYQYYDTKTGKQVGLTNQRAITMAFNDYYDAIVNTRTQLEKWMKDHNIFTDEDAKHGSNLAESGNPATVDRIIDGIMDGITANENHTVTYEKELEKMLTPHHFKDTISAYITYLVRLSEADEAAGIKSKRRAKKKGNPVIKLSYSTPSDRANFSGDRIFINGDRDAWLNGDVGALIPFYDDWANGNLTTSLTGLIDGTDDTIEMIKIYHKKICDLCNVMKNLNSLLVSDGSRIRMYTKKSQKMGAAWVSRIDTGLPVSMFDFSKVKVDEDNKETAQTSLDSEAKAEDQLMRTARAADIDNGFIASDFVKTNFRPIINAVKDCIAKYRDEFDAVPPPFAVTSTAAVIPQCPFHTMMYATTEGGNAVLYIKTTCGYATIKENDNIEIFPDGNEPVKYDPENKLFVYRNGSEAELSSEELEKLLNTMSNKDMMYCVANLFTKKYAAQFVKDTVTKYQRLSKDCFVDMLSWIADAANQPNDLKPEDLSKYMHPGKAPTESAKRIYGQLIKSAAYTEKQMTDIRNMLVYMMMDSILHE